MEERRINRKQYDPSRLLTHAALLFVGLLIIFVSAIIAIQFWAKGSANTESWAALTGLIGWATSQTSIIYSARYGTTQNSITKDAIIAQQASSAAVIAAAASGAPQPPAAPEPSKVENVNSPTTTGVQK